jgi:hypothetical protein
MVKTQQFYLVTTLVSRRTTKDRNKCIVKILDIAELVAVTSVPCGSTQIGGKMKSEENEFICKNAFHYTAQIVA